VIILSALVVKCIEFGNTHNVQSPVREVRTPIVLQEVFPLKPALEVLSPWVEMTEGIQVDTPIEQKILDLWGERYFLLATSIFRCESGLRPDAVNWSSKDVGVTQINWPTWEKPILEKFGYTLVDMLDTDKNLEVAYWIWDRADGEEGNEQGSFEPWVAYTNGSFRGCIE